MEKATRQPYGSHVGMAGLVCLAAPPSTAACCAGIGSLDRILLLFRRFLSHSRAVPIRLSSPPWKPSAGVGVESEGATLLVP